MGKYSLDLKEYARLSREAVAESCVLIKNDDNALPLKSGDKVAVLGRSAFNYYKSGLGSGGLVNTRYVITILDALRNPSPHSPNAFPGTANTFSFNNSFKKNWKILKWSKVINRARFFRI